MIVKGLEYLALMTASAAFALGYLLFFMEALPALDRRLKAGRRRGRHRKTPRSPQPIGSLQDSR